MLFNSTYHWRVKVWETAPGGGLGNDSGWVTPPSPTYKTVQHSGPLASFTYSPNPATATNPVSFSNTSTCYNNSNNQVACQSYIWNFGDSTTSAVQNPTKTYSATGTYLVNLKTYDDIGFCETNINVQVNSKASVPNFKEVSPF
jgi:PKD repeat protein